MRRAPGELKHLSTPRNRQHPRSSGERNGVSPNHDRGKAAAVAVVGLKGALRGDCRPPRARRTRATKPTGKRRHRA